MKSRAHVFVTGIVQGVSFRSGTREFALSRGVSGWVRNLPDGRVEAVLEGDRERVEETIAFLKRGPPGSRVRDVGVSWESPGDSLRGFEIRH